MSSRKRETELRDILALVDPLVVLGHQEATDAVVRHVPSFPEGSFEAWRNRHAPDTLEAMMRDRGRPARVRLRIYRAAEGLTQAELAKRLGVLRGSVEGWEGAEGRTPRSPARGRIEELTGIPADEWT